MSISVSLKYRDPALLPIKPLVIIIDSATIHISNRLWVSGLSAFRTAGVRGLGTFESWHGYEHILITKEVKLYTSYIFSRNGNGRMGIWLPCTMYAIQAVYNCESYGFRQQINLFRQLPSPSISILDKGSQHGRDVEGTSIRERMSIKGQGGYRLHGQIGSWWEVVLGHSILGGVIKHGKCRKAREAYGGQICSITMR